MAYAGVLIRESRGPKGGPKEQAVAGLWSNAHTLSEGLRTEDGQRFRVVYPGRPGGAVGPDFRDTVIATEAGEILTGDVEVHVKAPDWNSHRHHLDPAYNGVVLHVVLYPKGRKTSDQQSRLRVPVASLEGSEEALGPDEAARLTGPNVWGRLDRPALEELLDRAGDDRFMARSRGFALELETSDPEQALYGAVMEALGYSANRKPFRDLARRAPISRLRGLRLEPASTRLLAIKAVLLNTAGLIEHVTMPQEEQRLKGLLRHLPGTPRMATGSWRLSGLRPANHPARRIVGAAYLLDRYMASGLVNGIEKDITAGGARHLVKRLTVPPAIGTGRAREVAVNVALPFMHAWAGLRGDLELGRCCVELYQGFPTLPENEITREMKRLLAPEGRSINLRGARRHQGLMHLYRVMTARGSVRDLREAMVAQSYE